jgi:hypothetical protein
VDLKVNGAGCPGLDALGAPIDNPAKAGGTNGDRKVQSCIIKDLRFAAALPTSNLLLEPAPQRFGIKRSAIEEDCFYRRETR